MSAPVSAPAVTSAAGRSERPAACVLFDSGRLSVFKNPLQSDVNLEGGSLRKRFLKVGLKCIYLVETYKVKFDLKRLSREGTDVLLNPHFFRLL